MSHQNILITPLARISTVGGDVLHAMKKDDQGYSDFGEAYFSLVSKGSIKGWKRHKLMTMNVIIPMGNVRFVLYISQTKEFQIYEIGVKNYARLTIPPEIWFGFQGLASPQSLVLNIGDISHDPEEVERLELSEIKYDWS
jgi:dTDP-4-dehydrorhamnose 3,5-epimerase